MKNMRLYAATFILLLLSACDFGSRKKDREHLQALSKDTVPAREEVWQAPDTSTIPHNQFGDMVRYGRELILHTAYYIGPEGKVSKNLGNKMNCTNCHLDAGTKPYAFNYFSAHARYPQYRGRENQVLTLADRVNNCIERPHNGKALKLESKEMTAIVCYMKWLGKGVAVDKHVEGDSPLKIALMDRAADPVKGAEIYKRECVTCHGLDGEGKMALDGTTYQYPPLWGMHSYQPGSSLHRVVKAAAFIYANMPNKLATYLNPKLSVEESFDVAAFINDDRIHKRPVNKGLVNYPNKDTKPLDYGTGPFIDSFPADQHKYGPWKPIVEYRVKNKLHSDF